MFSSKLTTKAQTVIPQEVRRHLGVGPGDDVSYELALDGSAIIRRRSPKASLDAIDRDLPLVLAPYQHDLDHACLNPVDGLDAVELEGIDAAMFLSWATQTSWRDVFERDLQSVAQDSEGRPLLTTWVPLSTFREEFCAGGRQTQSEGMAALMGRLRAAMRGWRAAGVDTVDFSGRIKLFDKQGRRCR